jgi:hypothetical protein
MEVLLIRYFPIHLLFSARNRHTQLPKHSGQLTNDATPTWESSITAFNASNPPAAQCVEASFRPLYPNTHLLNPKKFYELYSSQLIKIKTSQCRVFLPCCPGPSPSGPNHRNPHCVQYRIGLVASTVPCVARQALRSSPSLQDEQPIPLYHVSP